MAEDFLNLHSTNPAVVAAEEFIAALLITTDLPPKLRKQLDRLRVGGASRREMLVNALSVFGLFHYHPNANGLRSVSAMNIGRRVLLTVPAPRRTTARGNGYTVRPAGPICEALGEILLDKLSRFAVEFWTAAQARSLAPSRALKSLNDALASNPFNTETLTNG